MPTLGYKRFDDEPKNWQHVTAADLEECAVNLSDTDDELDRSAVGVEESQRWTQSIAPGKYYSRVLQIFSYNFKSYKAGKMCQKRLACFVPGQ